MKFFIVAYNVCLGRELGESSKLDLEKLILFLKKIDPGFEALNLKKEENNIHTV